MAQIEVLLQTFCTIVWADQKYAKIGRLLDAMLCQLLFFVALDFNFFCP